jgi:hypothetical protein
VAGSQKREALEIRDIRRGRNAKIESRDLREELTHGQREGT